MLKILFSCFALLYLYPCMYPSNMSDKMGKKNPAYLWYGVSTGIGLITFFSLFNLYVPLHNKVHLSGVFFLDSMSAPLITLSLWISFLMILASYKIKDNRSEHEWFLTMVISLLMILVITFSVSNLIHFYIFFELSLVPTFILIMTWGYQPERLQASMYMMLYTISASLPLLISLMLIYINFNSLSMLNMIWIVTNNYEPYLILWWMMTMIAFFVKIPLYMFHLWLPKAHVEAPVAGSMILAGLLLKLGGYGMIRMSVIFYHMNLHIMPIITSVSLWGMFMTGMICLRQSDIKSLIAYSSVGHMGLMVVGVMSMTTWGLIGALAMMISHGLCSSGMFAAANIMYEITSTRSIILQKGFMMIIPSFSLMFFLLCCGNMAAPPFISLVSEILLMVSALSISFVNGIFLGLSSFLSCAYSLYLYSATQHGEMSCYMNFNSTVKSVNYTLLFYHIFPLLVLILNVNMFTESFM